MTLREKMFLIADTYGYDAQSRQCIEEMAELTQAINKFWRKQLQGGLFTVEEIRSCGNGISDFSKLKDTDGYRNLVEEIADVKIMIEQLEYFLVADVTPIMERKLDRQLKRIQEKRLEKKYGIHQGTTSEADDK